MPDPYEALGIARDASLQEAKAAYRRLAMLFHPDRLQDLRPAVRAEGARRLREATEALREVQARFGRPLRAASHAPGPSRPQGGASEQPAGGAVDVFVPRERDARLYSAELSAVEGPRLLVRWGGKHAAALLSVLKREHRIGEGAIRQIEWGAFEVRLPGPDMRGLLHWVMPGGCGDTRATVVAADRSIRGRLAIDVDAHNPEVPLRSVVDVLEDELAYSVIVDLY